MAVALKRIDLEKGEDALSRANLLTEAVSVFGEYDSYGNRKIGAPISTKLRLALAKLEIAPIDDRLVAKYKAQKSKRQRLWKKSEVVLLLMSAVFGVTSLTAFAAGIAWYLGKWQDPGGYNMFGIGILALLPTAFCGAIGLSHDGARWREGRWQRTGIATQLHTVPDFAIARAIAVKKECPEAEMYIDYLTVSEYETRRPDPDPFLVAKLGNEEFYLDVWNEPQFERLI